MKLAADDGPLANVIRAVAITPEGLAWLDTDVGFSRFAMVKCGVVSRLRIV